MAYAEGVQHILFTLWHESTEEITNQQAARAFIRSGSRIDVQNIANLVRTKQS